MTAYQRDCLERVHQLLGEARTLAARTTLGWEFLSELDNIVATAKANLGEEDDWGGLDSERKLKGAVS